MKLSRKTVKFASRIRELSLKIVARARASHIGGSLSLADVLAVLYEGILNIRPEHPDWPQRDRLILSKGHCCASLYSTLAIKGFIPLEELQMYGQDGSRLMAHASHKIPGVEFSTGSLGHGLPFGCGKALAAKRKKQSWRTFVLLSDGELDEGSNWESILFAPQHKLDNLVAIVDYNKIQSLGSVAEVMELEPLSEKFKAFRWGVREIDGHDHDELRQALCSVPFEKEKPSCLIAHTIKGRGVSFMENQLKWHYASPNQEQMESALTEIQRDIF